MYRAITIAVLSVAEYCADIAVRKPYSVGADLAVLRGGAGIRAAPHLAGHPTVEVDRVRVMSTDGSTCIKLSYLPVLGTGILLSGFLLLYCFLLLV